MWELESRSSITKACIQLEYWIFLCFSRHQSWHFGFLAPWNTWMWQRMFLGTSEFKIRNLIWNGSFCNLCALALWLALHIFVTQCWRAPIRAKQLSTVAILLYQFLSCWCLEMFFTYNVVSALQSIAGILKTLKGKGLVVSLSAGITRLIKKLRLTSCHVCLLRPYRENRYLQDLPNTTVELNSFLGHFADSKYFLYVTLTRETTLCPNVLIFYNLPD